MESRFVNIYVHAVLHQLVYVVEHAVGRQWDVALCRYHHLHLYAALYGTLKSAFQLAS